MSSLRLPVAAVLAAAAAAAALVGGCSSGRAPDKPSDIVRLPSERTINERIVEMSFAQQQREGAIIGRTIYVHHFVHDCPELNLLGERQVEAMLPICAGGPLKLNVLRGDAADELYKARVDVVRAAFVDAGVAEDRIALVETLPSGEGISSERSLQIAARDQQRAQATAASGQGMGSDRGRAGGASGGGSGSGGGSTGNYK